MALITRSAWRGWMPDAEAVSGPADALLRADNLTLDELGGLTLRRGSSVQQSGLPGSDVHSLFTGVLNGSRYRLAGSGSAITVNGSTLVSPVTGSGDVAFGSHVGQLLMARGTTTKKYDGTTLRNWGIAMTGGAPTVVATPPKRLLIASCDQSGPAFTVPNDDGTGVTFTTGQDGTATGAVVLHPRLHNGNPDFGIGDLDQRFATTRDLTVYGDATAVDPADLITLYVYVADANKIDSITLLVDVNPDSVSPYNDDYYQGDLSQTVSQALASTQQALLGNYTAQGSVRDAIAAQLAVTPSTGPVTSVSTSGWSKLAIPRAAMTRNGTTAGKDWRTACGFRLLVRTTNGVTETRFDAIAIETAGQVGTYKWAYCLAYNSGTYVALSPPSPYSTELTMQSASAAVTIPADASRDPQVNEVWVFRMGGVLNAFYRTAIQTGVSGVGVVSATDALTDVDALVVNIPLEIDNQLPPANIIGIAGPYYDRTFVLTSDGFLHPSRRLNPDAFASGQVIRVASPDERAYWVRQMLGGLYVGTSKDIYRISGTGAELPDGSIDFIKDPVNVDHPPIGDGVAHDGNLLLFQADDGWRSFTGNGTQSIVGETSLLYRGQTRYGVGPVLLEAGRFRATIGHGHLLAITPEGSTTSSSAIYRYVPARSAWYRTTYPVSFRSLTTERDGTVLAGDTTGNVWALDVGSSDGGSAIPVVLWTKADDLGDAFHEKQLSNLHVRGDLGSASFSAALSMNGADTVALTAPVALSGPDIATADLLVLPSCRQVQLRLTGSATTCRITALAYTALALPVAVRAWDSGPAELGGPELVWLRAVRVKLVATAALIVTPFVDGRPMTPQTIHPDLRVPTHVTAWFDRGIKGRVARVTITSTGTFQPYWAEFIRRETGTKTDKGTIRVGAE